MGAAHKHADLIKAWADGAEIQFLDNDVWVDCFGNIPKWRYETDYRIKPEPNPDVVKYVGFDFNTTSVGGLHDSIDTVKNFGWSTFFKITKSGETGEFTAVVIS